MTGTRFIHLLFLLLAALSATPLAADQIEYQRPVEVAPSEETIGEGYVTPEVQHPLPRAVIWQVADVVLLAIALGVAAWLALWKRKRGWVVALTVACVAYFGFYREGCICPIGSIQNVALAIGDSTYPISLAVVAFFAVPLAFTLFFGRTFCSSVCPLGAVQELVTLHPIKVPGWLDRSL